MQPVFPSMRITADEAAAEDGGEAAYYAALNAKGAEGRADGLPVFSNVVRDAGAGGDVDGSNNEGDDASSYRVSWFYYDTHPTLAFLFWAHRRLRELPPDWQHYYRTFLRQEVKSQLSTNTTWDVFIAVVDGYRKAKWVLRKYDVPVDESLIPHPYNNFWEVTTPEERAWAYRRSVKMKEAQAAQRALEGDLSEEEDDLRDGDDLPTPSLPPSTASLRRAHVVSGGQRVDLREMAYDRNADTTTSKTDTGSRLHSADMAAPSERDIHYRSESERVANDLVMGTVEDDKLWNPVLRNRLHQQRTREEDHLYAFEDDDEFEPPKR